MKGSVTPHTMSSRASEKKSPDPVGDNGRRLLDLDARTDYHEIVLDPNDPFEAALLSLVGLNRAKRADYALSDDPFSNFRATSAFAGFEEPWLSALFNCSQKLARITSLRSKGKLEDPTNETVSDTLLDLAVYSVIALAIHGSNG